MADFQHDMASSTVEDRDLEALRSLAGAPEETSIKRECHLRCVPEGPMWMLIVIAGLVFALMAVMLGLELVVPVDEPDYDSDTISEHRPVIHVEDASATLHLRSPDGYILSLQPPTTNTIST